MSTMTNERAGCECGFNGDLHIKYMRCLRSALAPLTPEAAMYEEWSDKTGIDYAPIDASYCPMCGRSFNLRPMTLEEAVAYGGPVWEEVRTQKVMEFGWWRTPEHLREARPPYRCRYWAWKPTPEQSAAWKWEEEEA